MSEPTRDPLGCFVPEGQVRVEGAAEGPLAGMTFAAKDIYDLAGHVTGCGNPDWRAGREAAAGHAWAVARLLEAGAACIGKVITDEMAYSLNGQNFHYGTPANANAPGRIPGGSSSGSASAVAGGLCDTALGSDTGGSVRIPASYCGLYGIRPTHGRISLEGVMPLAPSLDTCGWFARDAGVLRRVGEVLLEESAEAAPQPERMILAEDAWEQADESVRTALAPQVERLQARLGAPERLRLAQETGGLQGWGPHFRHILAWESWDQHGAWIEGAKPRFGPEIQQRFDWGKTITDDAIAQARELREVIAARLAAILTPGSVICLPTAPSIAPQTASAFEVLQEQRFRVHSLTCIAGLGRLPQVTMPLGQVEGCPVGLSLIGAAGSDMSLLAFAESLAADPELPDRFGPGS